MNSKNYHVYHLKSLLKIVFGIILLFTSCKKTPINNKEVNQKIVLEKLENSPSYSDAVLKLKDFDSISYSGQDTINFNFEVKNYNLGIQTESPNNNELANSKKGQHIHFILNNQPYSAHYNANFKKVIPNGVNHLVAFLSRSYHESVKNKNSVVVKKLITGSHIADTTKLNMEAPTIIYSRPKGKYSGKDTKRILLDFFVLNTTISKNGNKVKVNINNQEFLVTDWMPYIISGLPLGKTTIELELVDAEDNLIPGPFNKVKRTITLTE
jgi:hypothetical protein